MPGFKRRRHYRVQRSSQSGRGGFRGGNIANNNVGARHLDRGMSAGSYYGGMAPVYGEEPEHVRGGEENAPAPVCYEHALECVRFVCKKAGKNKGRAFYKCSRKQRHDQCDFFQWADEVGGDVFSDDEGEPAGSQEAMKVEAPALVEESSDEEAMDVALEQIFKLDAFRPGQREVLSRLLGGRSTLALLPTGAGKSLIFQAYAALRPGVVVVVTPLVSLMENQIQALPGDVPGACLRSGQSMEVILEIEERMRRGLVKVLFVSPERLFSSRFRRLLQGQAAPRVSLVVVDEAHCLSQWSHNFRTAYLRIPSALFQRAGTDGTTLEPLDNISLFKEDPLVLALTATATKATAADICGNLKINFDSNVVRCESSRDNLSLTLSRVEGTVEAKAYELVLRLKREPFGTILGLVEADAVEISNVQDLSQDQRSPNCTKKRHRSSRNSLTEDNDKMIGWGSNLNVPNRVRGPKRGKSKHNGSVIVYVSKQRDCEAVKNYLRSSALQLRGKVAMYHAGMAQADRHKAQSQFENGSVAVLVATVAFGMGLNYSNVLGIFHFDMPSSLEGYSQEVGRAGRDGRNAFCHVFYNDHDARKLLSRSCSDGVDASVVRRFLRKLVENSFEYRRLKQRLGTVSESGVQQALDIHSDQEHERGILADSFILSISELDICRSLDIRYETAETICAILEREVDGVRLLKSSHMKVRVKFFSQSPEALLQNNTEAFSPVDKLVIHLIQKRAKQSSGQYDLWLRQAGLLEDDVGASLRRLQNRRHISFEVLERGLHVHCSSKGFDCLKENVDRWAGLAHSNLEQIEKVREQKAKAVARTFSVADGMISEMEQTGFLHDALVTYFAENTANESLERTRAEDELEDLDESTEERIRQASTKLLQERCGSMQVQTGRQIARILHGINSAGFRAKDWWNCGYWGKFIDVNFRVVMAKARDVIREKRTLRRERQA